ncbi:hypothetical protein [Variovorax sp. GT1P44]|uniref:hypothetical protein n=1 Tax=Variovorax sp. GT1P44 TaxID=3443742 RepID=UPI003F452C01
MTNPWPTSNPFMSVWLSTANQMMSTAHGMAASMMQRQASAMQAEFEKQVIDFWTGGWLQQMHNSLTKPPSRQ